MNEFIMQSAVDQGLRKASGAFSTMIGMETKLSSQGWRQVGLNDMATLTGGIESMVVAVYVRFRGDIPGHAIFIFEPAVAEFLADAILGEVGEEHIRSSALCELGNVASSSILNEVADSTELAVYPSPPMIVTDMAGAILQAIAVSMAASDRQAVVLETTISIDDHPYSGHFLIVPDREDDGIRLGVLA